MIGFYLAIDKITNGGIKLFSSVRELLTDLDSRQKGLCIFEDDHLQMAQGNGYTIFNIGTLIYKNTWQSKALELIIRDLNNGKTIQDMISNTRGQFCLIVHTVTDVFVITDRLSSFPVYIFEDDNTIQISNLLLLLAKNNKVSINKQAFAEYLSFDYCFGSTFFNEIKQLSMATIYQFGTDRKTQIYDNLFSDIRFNRYTDLYEIADVTKETLADNLSFLSSHDRIFVDITGGFDTRTVAAILRSMNIDFKAGICGEQILKESELAEKVAQALGVKFRSDIKITGRHLFNEILNEHFTINTGVPILYYASELINYYKQIKCDFDIHISGFGGTELTTQDLPKLNLLSSRINKKSLFRRLFSYNDIFIDGFLTKSQYYDNLTKKIDGLLQKGDSDLHNEVANFLHFSSVNRCFHGCLVGTHNMIMPFYSPFLESNYLKLMMETSYNLKGLHLIQRKILTELNPRVSSIMTSHGYSANIDFKRPNSAFERSKKYARDIVRRAIYQFGFSFKTMNLIKNIMGKVKPPVNLEEIQRSFWVAEVNKTWSDNMEIFELIDQDKLNSNLTKGRDVSKLKAKILYLNRIIKECRPKL